MISKERRKLLKLLAAGGGTVLAASLVPMRWTKPLVEVGLLPAHAQMSGVTPGLQAVMDWETSGTNTDLELHIVDPQGGTDVFGGNTTSATLTHNGDAPQDDMGTETAGNTTPGVVAAGTYQIYLRSVDSDYGSLTDLTVDITVNGAVTNFSIPSPDNFFSTNPQSLRIADVTFPAGTLTNRVGQSYP